MHLSVIVLVGFLAYAYGEQCTTTRSCDHVVCDTGYHVVCVRSTCACATGPAPGTSTGTGGTTSGVKCDSVRACTATNFPSCRAEYTHCVDGYCRCLPNFGTGK